MGDTNKSEKSDVMTLDDMCQEAKLSEPVMTRPLRRGKLKGTLVPGGAGWRCSRRVFLDWVDDGMPGIEPWTEAELAAMKGGAA